MCDIPKGPFRFVLSDNTELSVPGDTIEDALREVFGYWMRREIPAPKWMSCLTDDCTGIETYEVDIWGARCRPVIGDEWINAGNGMVSTTLTDGTWEGGEDLFSCAIIAERALFDERTFAVLVSDLDSHYFKVEKGPVSVAHARPDSDGFVLCDAREPDAFEVWMMPYRMTSEVNRGCKA